MCFKQKCRARCCSPSGSGISCTPYLGLHSLCSFNPRLYRFVAVGDKNPDLIFCRRWRQESGLYMYVAVSDRDPGFICRSSLVTGSDIAGFCKMVRKRYRRVRLDSINANVFGGENDTSNYKCNSWERGKGVRIDLDRACCKRLNVLSPRKRRKVW